eukprot:6185227-Pleurochrysis_carterae.AAC.2
MAAEKKAALAAAATAKVPKPGAGLQFETPRGAGHAFGRSLEVPPGDDFNSYEDWGEMQNPIDVSHTPRPAAPQRVDAAADADAAAARADAARVAIEMQRLRAELESLKAVRNKAEAKKAQPPVQQPVQQPIQQPASGFSPAGGAFLNSLSSVQAPIEQHFSNKVAGDADYWRAKYEMAISQPPARPQSAFPEAAAGAAQFEYEREQHSSRAAQPPAAGMQAYALP